MCLAFCCLLPGDGTGLQTDKQTSQPKDWIDLEAGSVKIPHMGDHSIVLGVRIGAPKPKKIWKVWPKIKKISKNFLMWI